MKKRLIALFVTGICASVLAAVPAAGLTLFDGIKTEDNYVSQPWQTETAQEVVVALDDLGFSVNVTEYVQMRQEDGFVYLHTMSAGSIPYIIMGTYDTAEDSILFAQDFTEYMAGVYSDLKIIQEPQYMIINDRTYARVTYQYSIGGYVALDTRLFLSWNGHNYMFGSKEIPALDYYVGAGYLEKVAGSFAQLAGGWGDYEKHVDSEHSLDSPLKLQFPTQKPTNPEPKTDEPETETGTEKPSTRVGKRAGKIGKVEPETEAEPEIDSIEFDESYADYEGTWVQFEDGFQIYLPSEWVWYYPTEEQEEEGVLYIAGEDSDSDTAPYIMVNWMDSGDTRTIEDLAGLAVQAGFQFDGYAKINDIMAIMISSDDIDMNGVCFFHPETTDYFFGILAGEFAANPEVDSTILCSLSLYQE